MAALVLWLILAEAAVHHDAMTSAEHGGVEIACTNSWGASAIRFGGAGNGARRCDL